MLWAIYGILHSLLRAAFVETCRATGVDGWRMGFWQALAGFLLLLPLTPFMHWPGTPGFYFAAAGMAVIFGIGMVIQLRLSEERKGRVTAIYMPLEAVAAMVLWLLINPYIYQEYGKDMLMSLSILMAFTFATYSLFRIRANDVSWNTFLVAAPMGLTYAVAGVVTKVILSGYEANVIPVVMTYILVAFAVMTVVMGTAVLVRRKTGPGFTAPPLVRAGIIGGMFSALGYGTFAISVAYAPNPGYTSMLAMLLPVWLLSWHGFLRLEDKASPIAALFIVISMMLLIVASH